MKRTKKYTLVILATILFLIGIPLSTMAYSNDKNEFNYEIDALGTNTGTENAYRSTTNPKNSWKVNLQTSTEGKGTYTRFWLENAETLDVSPTRTIKVGSGDHYTEAYASASKKQVYFTADNNNMSWSGYYITGYWDEETGVILK